MKKIVTVGLMILGIAGCSSLEKIEKIQTSNTLVVDGKTVDVSVGIEK